MKCFCCNKILLQQNVIATKNNLLPKILLQQCLLLQQEIIAKILSLLQQKVSLQYTFLSCIAAKILHTMQSIIKKYCAHLTKSNIWQFNY